MAIIRAIAVKSQKREPLVVRPEVEVTETAGIIGDCRGAGGARRSRQITLISWQSWGEACAALGRSPEELPWTLRRANICIDGYVFGSNHIGKQLRLGPAVIVQITGETTPCIRMDEAFPGLREVLAPAFRGGVTARVLKGGTLREGDEVSRPYLQPAPG
jgi:MOSC domain-containing protein YiiM